MVTTLNPFIPEQRAEIVAAAVTTAAAAYGVSEDRVRQSMATLPEDRIPVELSSCELWHITTALTDYKDSLMRELDAAPDSKCLRRHLQETVSLLDNLSNI